MTQLKDPKGILIGIKLWYYECSKYLKEFRRLQSNEWKRKVVFSCEEPNPCRQLGCVPVSAESSAQVVYSLRTSLLLTFEQFSNHMLGGQFNQYNYNIETAVLSTWGLLFLLRMLCSLKGQHMTPCVKRSPHFGDLTSNPGLR